MTSLRIAALVLITIQIFTEGRTDSVADLFDNYWELIVSSDPEYATKVGDNRFNDKLSNFSVAHAEELEHGLLQFQNQARELLGTANDDFSRTNLEFLIEEIDYRLKLFSIKHYLFPLSYLDGPPNNLYELIPLQPMNSKEDFLALVARYNAFPIQAEEIIATLREGIRINMTLHERSFNNYEKGIEKLTSLPPRDSILFEPFRNISFFIPSEEIDGYLNEAERAISESIYPGLITLANFIQNEYRPHTRANIASSSLPDGRNYYNTVLNYYVTANVTPQIIHDMGIKEVDRISKEMENVIRSLGFQDDIFLFNDRIRSNTSMYYETQEEIFDAYTNVLRNEIEPKLPLIFKKMPKAKLEIKPVPKQNPNAPIGYYIATIVGNTTKGFFYLNSLNLRSVPKHMTVTLTLHEADPGHHFQTAYRNELQGVPKFRTRSTYPLYTAFSEGWGLYSEYLGNEMGVYEDPYMFYGHLSQEIFRACRMVVDTGIHALGWSRHQAIEYMLNNSASSRKSIEDEVDRYITWPGQACAYKYGQLKIKEFRSEAENKLGSEFDVKEFHDLILSNAGALNFIKKQVDQFIASNQGSEVTSLDNL